MDLETDKIRFEQLIKTLDAREVAVLHSFNPNKAVLNKDLQFSHVVLQLNMRGVARVLYDEHEMYDRKNVVAVILPNHKIRVTDCSDDYCITQLWFSNSFAQELKVHSMSHDYSKYHSIPDFQLSPEQGRDLLHLIEAVDVVSRLTVEQLPNRHTLLLNLLDSLYEVLKFYRSETDMNNQWASQSDELFSQFCTLLNKHYKESHSASFYAEKLHLTPKYFSKRVETVAGVSAHDWIEKFLLNRSQLLLRSRKDMSLQQIGFELGFDEQVSFCRFFKRMTGLTPKQYRYGEKE